MITRRDVPAFAGDFIQSSFEPPKKKTGELYRFSPADFEDRFGVLEFSTEQVDRAVDSAHQAFRLWKQLTLTDRIVFLQKLKEEFTSRKSDLSEILAREVGKPLWEAQGEIDAMSAKIDISISEGLIETKDREIPAIMVGNVTGACRFKPLGVVAVLGPFNFPAHLPNGHWVPALLAGNTVIFKPSEQAPLIAQEIARCFLSAGFPKGVFNLVQGDRHVGEKLATHTGVSGVFFTGSYAVGRALKAATLDQPHKLLALEMGGKNTSIVHSDAHMDLALAEILMSINMTTGQRCSATSRVLVHETLYEIFAEKLIECTKKLRIGHPLDNSVLGPFMGPLINESSMKRYLDSVANAKGVQVILAAAQVSHLSHGYYVEPSLSEYEYKGAKELSENSFLNDELFAPHATLMRYGELEEAIEIANTSEYGLAGSVFSKDQKIYQQVFDNLDCGLINWNKSTTGGSSRLPFGGLKKSGNYFPTALFASRYCSHPVASLENRDSFFQEPAIPGINWKE